MVEKLVLAEVKSGLKDRGSLLQFMSASLGYKVDPVLYENPTQDLRIPGYLASKINSWWLVCSYPGKVPFQIYFAEIRELTFYLCRDIVDAFLCSHPANYLFIFTKDYRYMLFLSVERSLEKRPYTWRLGTKYYWRQLFVNCCNPGSSELLVLDRLRIDPACTDPLAIYDKVIGALKLASNDIPEWFMPWYYRMGFSVEGYERLHDSRMI